MPETLWELKPPPKWLQVMNYQLKKKIKHFYHSDSKVQDMLNRWLNSEQNKQSWNLLSSLKTQIWRSWANTHRQRDLCLLEEGIPFFFSVLLPCTWQNLTRLPVSFCLSLQDDPSRGWEGAVSVIAPMPLHSSIFLTASADAVWNFPGPCDFSWLMWLPNWGEGDEDDRLLKAFKKIPLEKIIAHLSYMQPLIRLSKQQYLKPWLYSPGW